MDREILNGVELEVARDNALALAVDIDVEDGREETPGADAQADLLGVQRNCSSGGAGSVDDGGCTALTTHGSCGPLAAIRPRLSLDLLHGGHCVCPSVLRDACRTTSKARPNHR